MFTDHALFPVKFINILNIYEESKKGRNSINLCDHIKEITPRTDGLTRTVMSSPPLFDIIESNIVSRIRLAYTKDLLYVHSSRLELYTAGGELVKFFKYDDWSMALSLAIEAELLEKILNINPL